jgi:hypothetical protein
MGKRTITTFKVLWTGEGERVENIDRRSFGSEYRAHVDDDAGSLLSAALGRLLFEDFP